MTESDYARFVLTPPSPEQLRDKADQERKAAKENSPTKDATPSLPEASLPRSAEPERLAAASTPFQPSGASSGSVPSDFCRVNINWRRVTANPLRDQEYMACMRLKPCPIHGRAK